MIKLLTFIFFVSSAFAGPKSLEVWYISNKKSSGLFQILNRPTFIYRPLTAELQCQEMGDYCFDPQFGLYKKEDVFSDTSGEEVEKKAVPGIPSGKSFDRDLINCDPTNYFDIFCGKAKKENPQKKAKLEIWVDISSSMREFDPTDKSGSCYRKSLIQTLDKSCEFNSQMTVMGFDTSIKQLGSPDSLCMNVGLNDYKRLIDWIERSEAEKLVVITDVYELHKDFAVFLEKNHAVQKGDKDPLSAAQMMDLVSYLSNMCK